MKKRNLFAMSLVGLAMVACSSDDEVNQMINPQEGAFVSLQLDVAKPATKGSPNATNEQPGKGEENTISDVTVVVDYGNSQKSFTSSASGSGVSWDGKTKTLSFKAPEGDAFFYVYANVNVADNLTSNWAADLVSSGTVSNYYANNMFFMSNQNGKGVKHTILAEGKNNVTVNIERAAAKVTVESKKSFTDATHGGTITAMSYALGNMVDKFYLLQQPNYAIPTDAQYLPTSNAAEDAWRSVTLDQSVNGESAVDKTTLDAIYCMENVQNSYLEGNTTYAKFQTTFIPGKALDFDVKSDGSGLTVKGTLKEVTETTPQTFYVVLESEGLNANYILASDLESKTGVKLTEADGATTVEGIEGISKISLPYTNGKCYFGPVWFNDQEDKSKSPVYRNDWYHLTVTSIKLPGSPVEPEGEGDKPINQGTDITVTATVLNWEWEERDIELQ